ncbi:MAG: hypothetical protein HONBIEJF_02905 [Fimbriimonadaceae bacterium]|nr:hypothetical protein [Fimbriimonadaceae bacterium]
MLFTGDDELAGAARSGIPTSDDLVICGSWQAALDACENADMIFVDMLATLEEPHKVGGYEKFANAKMDHPAAKSVPLVLIAPPTDYSMDFMAGWPNFVFAHVRRPVTEKIFRRASTWV